MVEEQKIYIGKKNKRILVLPEFQNLFKASITISSKYTLTLNIQNFMASFLELWKCFKKTISKIVIGQKEFDQMELE